MSTLDGTVGGATANSYVISVAEAETYADTLRTLTYFGVDLTGWDAVGSPNSAKIEALILAARRTDQLSHFATPASGSQARLYPATNLPIEFDAETIPDPCKLAQVADAAFLLNTQSTEEDWREQGVVSQRFGEKTTTYRDGNVGSRSSSRAAPAAEKILRSAGLLQGSAGSVSVGRG